MSETTIDRLSKSFPPEMLKSLDKGGTRLSYIPVAEVIARLNEVLEADWSYQVLDRWAAGEKSTETGVYPLMCMAHVRLTIIDEDGHTATRDGIGGQPVKFLRDGSAPVDLGDEWKGAVSDALKKAAQHFGVGLDIARKEDALKAEAAEKQRAEHEATTKAGGWESVDDHEARLADIRKRASALGDDAKFQLRNWWNEQQWSLPLTVGQADAYDAKVAGFEQHEQRPFDDKTRSAA